jgi:hypothetical protein
MSQAASVYANVHHVCTVTHVQVEEVYNDGLTAAQQLLQQAEQQADTAIPSQKAKKLKPSDEQFKIDYLQHLTLARLVFSVTEC